MVKTGRVRSALFTPGTEAERLRKAVTLGADVCIFDLEDSVPAARVDEARDIVRGALLEVAGATRIWIRVHPASNRAMLDDLAALPLNKADGIVLPKVGGAHDLAVAREAIDAAKGPSDIPLIAIIESAAGAVNVADIARMPTVFCLAFGRLDLSADLGIDPAVDTPTLAAARAAVVLNSRAAGLHQPLESPWVNINDLEGLRSSAQTARDDGFGGMLLIHPSHVAVANEVFSPTENEVAWARAITAAAQRGDASGRGAYTVDKQMVDEAVVRRARAILEEFEATAKPSSGTGGTA